MKRLLISSLLMAMAVIAMAPIALASQVDPGDLDADINEDGTVSHTELWQYNNDERGS